MNNFELLIPNSAHLHAYVCVYICVNVWFQHKYFHSKIIQVIEKYLYMENQSLIKNEISLFNIIKHKSKEYG